MNKLWGSSLQLKCVAYISWVCTLPEFYINTQICYFSLLFWPLNFRDSLTSSIALGRNGSVGSFTCQIWHKCFLHLGFLIHFWVQFYLSGNFLNFWKFRTWTITKNPNMLNYDIKTHFVRFNFERGNPKVVTQEIEMIT